jgi:hypothetical protein
MSNGRAHVRHLLFLVFFALGVSGSAAAASKCNGTAAGSKAYVRATQVVHKLPEVEQWSRSHQFPVAYGSMVDKQVLIGGKCYWSVTVYADRTERLELWQVFYVGSGESAILVEDSARGEPVSIAEWRQANGGR